MKQSKRRRWIFPRPLLFVILLLALSSCSVIKTVSGLFEGRVQSGQPREVNTTIGDLRLQVWCSQAVYELGEDPFEVGTRLTNEGDDLEILYQEDGPLAQLVVEPPNSFALVMEARGEEADAQIELEPGQSFEIVWNLSAREEGGNYYVKAIFWTEKRGPEEAATDCLIRH
jgi:hypothetical protein